MKNYLMMITMIGMLSVIPLSFADQKTYNLEAGEKTFDITYSFDGDLISIDVDKESTSLLVGTQNLKDSVFEISFPAELLSAQNAEFVVLVDGLETDYTTSYNDNNPTITFPIPADSEEIEIIGTSVVPEFPLGALAIMGIVSTAVIVFSRTRLRLFK
jgi:hypothetical protein